MAAEYESILDKLDSMAPTPLKTFDAFPKLPSTYKERTESRGFLTLFVALLAFVLVLNDIGEFIWGWPDYEFSVDQDKGSFMNVNVDMIVNMPCAYLSVDLRDALGDRLHLSEGFKRDGTHFDIGQATILRTQQEQLSATQVVAQSRRSRGLFATLFRRNKSEFRPTYNYQRGGGACRIYGSIQVKKVTANLHITTLGHGYASARHVDHKYMNLSHVITEFSFGPFIPDISQPLDYSFEIAQEPFTAYQYFLHVVPSTYVAPRSKPLRTHQYSVTHYTRVMEPDRGTPGIFFKFDLDPMQITIYQRTTSFLQLLIRCVGVIGGIFVCSGYAIRLGTHAVDAVTGADKTPGIVAAEATGAQRGLRAKWGGGELRARNTSLGKVVRQGNSWVVEGGSPYSSYAGTPMSGAFATTPASPYPASPYAPPSSTLNPPGSSFGLGFGPNSAFGPAPSPRLGTPATGASGFPSSPYLPQSPAPGSVGFAHFPPTPNPEASGFPRSPPPPPSRAHLSSGSVSGIPKKDD